MIEAVRRDGGALQYASGELKRDRGVVAQAVRQNGDAFSALRRSRSTTGHGGGGRHAGRTVMRFSALRRSWSTTGMS